MRATLRGVVLAAPLAVGVCFLAACSSSSDARPQETELFASKQGQAAVFFDLDGDGERDKLVAAPQAVRGGSVGVLLAYARREAGHDTEPTLQLNGGKSFAFALAATADVDGDGALDLAVSALHGSGPTVGLAGTVSVLAAGGKGEVLTVLEGRNAFARFGYSLASCDLDGDGALDLIVGAPFDSPSPALYQTGSVSVFRGPTFSEAVTIEATSAVKGLGWSVACGDANGDGLADLWLGASGKVLGFYGAAAFAPTVDVPDVVVSSTAADFGRALLVGPDYDGDGLAELVVGAGKAKLGNDRDVGSVYVVRGGTGTRTVALTASAYEQLLVRIDGAGLFSRFGWSLALTSDIDGDGRGELAVGAPYEDVTTEGKDMSGRVYVFESTKVDATTTRAVAKTIDGVGHHGTFGLSLTTGPQGELLVGAPRAGGDTGAAYLVDVASGALVPGGSTGGVTGTPIDDEPIDHDGHDHEHHH